MKIRLANKFDSEKICEMLKHFRSQTPISELEHCNDKDYILKLLQQMFVGGGVIYVAEKEDQLVGMIMGIISHSIWDQNLLMLREMAFWVEPEHRGSTAGHRLISAYTKYAKELVSQNRIKVYTMTKMVTSPDLSFDKFGYKKTEEVWVAGA